jgi:hypothetical protein
MTQAPRNPQRPDDETLRLAKRLADEVFSSRALAEGQRFQIQIEITPDEHSVSFAEPDRRDLRELLVLVRKFDMPSHDVRMRRLYQVVERVGVKSEWKEGLEQAKAAYEARDELREFHVQDPDEPPREQPTWIRPRQAFELWVYADVIHDDYSKEVRWRKLGPPAQGLVRQMAHDYLAALLEQVAFMRRLITYGLESTVLEEPS